jgi:tetratricopeptide (TPR) repeat protein
MSRTLTPSEPIVSRVPTPREPTISRTPTAPQVSRVVTESFSDARTVTLPSSALATHDVRSLIASRARMIDQGADHFTLLGVDAGASPEAVRAAYLELARALRPEKLAQLGIIDEALDAQRVFAQAGIAFTTLTHPMRRSEYLARLQGGAPVATQTYAHVVDRKALAAEAYERGRQALRAEQLDKAASELARAAELAPYEVDYGALLGWARFCASSNKAAVAADTRRLLERAIHRSPTPEVARFYLGRVERMLGRDQLALHHFREVLLLVPDHAEAASEVRVLESRMARGTRPPDRRR